MWVKCVATTTQVHTLTTLIPDDTSMLRGLAAEDLGFSRLFVPQGERSDSRSGGESSAAADGDNSGDAGRPTGGGDGFREESPKRLGR